MADKSPGAETETTRPSGVEPARAAAATRWSAAFNPGVLITLATTILAVCLLVPPALGRPLDYARLAAIVASGLLVCLLVVKKKADERLRASEARLRSYVENMPLAVFVVDPDGRLVDGNPAAAHMLRHDRGALAGMRVVDLVREDEREAALRHVAQVLAEGHVEAEHWLTRGDGRSILVSMKVVRAADDRYVGFCQDITAHREADRQMREREEKYRAALETSDDGFYVLDRDGRVLEVNDAYVRRSGYTREELLSMRVSDLEAFETPAETAAHMARVMRQGHDLFENRHRAKDGTVWQLETNTTYWPIAGGRFFVFMRDIRRRKRSEALLRARLQLSQLAQHATLDDLLKAALDAAELHTSSRVAFFHFVDRDGRGMTPQRWSGAAIGAARDADAHPLRATEMECIRSRSPMVCNHEGALSSERNPTERHAPLVRELLVPILRDAEVVAVMGVGNKPADYDEDDVEVLCELSSFLMDLANAKRAEDALRRSEERYRAVVESNADWVWEMDAGQRLVYASPGLFEALGRGVTEVIGRQVFDFMPEAEARRMRELFASAEATRQSFAAIEAVHVHADGRRLVLEISAVPVFGPGGALTGFRGSGRDITERKRAEAAIRERLHLEERLSSLAAASPGVIFTWSMRPDGSASFPYASAAAIDVCGIDAATMMHDASAAFALVHPADLRKLNASIGESAQKLSPWQCDFRVRHPIKGDIWLEGRSSPQRQADGSVVWHGFLHDITTRKQMELALRSQSEELRQAQKMEAIGRLSGGVAHDFNNILTVVQGHGSLLQADPRLPADLRRSADEIARAAERAANLTRQLLMFSRRQALQLRHLDLNEVVTHTTRMLQRILGEDIQMEFRFAPRPLILNADAGMLDQILLNLAVNSRDAMPNGGRLIVTTSEADFDEATAARSRSAQPGSYACLTVTDTGAGIAPDVLPRIFEPFFTTKEIGTGTGLGLATVFGIVQQHHGWITVDSEPGKGTTFQVFLPRLSGRAVRAAEEESLASMRGGSETILLVEDEQSVRTMVARVLSQLGYHVIEARSGPDALAQWTRHKSEIGLLLADVVMPDGMTGFDLGRQLLADRPELRVMYSSGYSAEAARKDVVLEEGVTFLTKPYNPRRLAQAVRACLDRVSH